MHFNYMPRLSLALGVNRASKLPSAAAPSGIPVATAGDLIITFGLFTDTQYTKVAPAWNFDYGDEEYQQLTYNLITLNTWVLDANNGVIRATNPSMNPLIIPTTGWIYIIGSGPSITITAA